MKTLAIAIFALALIGCSGDDERDAGPVQTGTPGNSTVNGASNNAASNGATNGTPNGATADMGTSDSGSGGDEDSGGVDVGLGEEPPTGEVCPYTDLRPYRGSCDAVRNTGCVAPEQCIPGIMVAGTDTDFTAFCRDAEEHVLEAGSACDSSNFCGPGTACISFYQECRRVCYPDTSLGCMPGEYCRRPASTWEGIGFCDSTCNL